MASPAAHDRDVERAAAPAGPEALDSRRADNRRRMLIAGAMCNVDLCEQEPDACRRTNTAGPAAAADYARDHGATMADQLLELAGLGVVGLPGI